MLNFSQRPGSNFGFLIHSSHRNTCSNRVQALKWKQVTTRKSSKGYFFHVHEVVMSLAEAGTLLIIKGNTPWTEKNILGRLKSVTPRISQNINRPGLSFEYICTYQWNDLLVQMKRDFGSSHEINLEFACVDRVLEMLPGEVCWLRAKLTAGYMWILLIPVNGELR